MFTFAYKIGPFTLYALSVVNTKILMNIKHANIRVLTRTDNHTHSHRRTQYSGTQLSVETPSCNKYNGFIYKSMN